MTEDSVLQVDVSRGVATLTLDSPANRNALSRAMRSQLRAALTEALADDAVRVVVLDHTGRVFCSGMDLSEAAGGGVQDQGVREFPDLLEAIWSSPKPVVAVVRGPARAGGVGLLAACDVVVAGASATFAFSEVRLGIVPAVISAVVLPRMVPHVAHRLMLTGQVFDAEVAVDGGLVDLVVPDADVDGEVRAQLVHLTAGAPAALAETKRLLRARHAAAGLRRAARAVGPLLRQRGGPGGHRLLPREAPRPLGAHRRLTARRWGSREAATPRREPREIPPRPGYFPEDERSVMPTDLLDLYRRASDWTAGKAAGTTDLDAATPCEEWRVRDLLAHMLDTQRYFVGRSARRGRPAAQRHSAPAVDAGPGRRPRGGADPAPRTRSGRRASSSGQARCWASPSPSSSCTAGTWPVRRTRTRRCPPGWPRPRTRRIHGRFTDEQRKGVFGPEVPVGAHATPQERLLAYTGRDPD